ncbi:MAG: right-handed parallel beta-helix repeat-containing protein [Chitinispirillaceae bacterium]|nr:right-handed parallel beta-helix repeat-containing protein [Chitinispirillaceae bacterium]
MRYSLLSGSLACVLVSIAFGADIYISPTGNDATGDGSIGAPYATLTKARDRADELKSGGTVNVYLRGGTYYLTAPVVFGLANTGTASAPINYRAYQSEKAVISGGFKVTTAWTTTTLNGVSVYTTNIGTNRHVDQLFLNGKRQIMARYPNYNASQQLQGYASDAVTVGNNAANEAEGPGYIRSLHTGLWGGEDYYYTGPSAYQWVGDNNRGGAMHSTYRMVENIIEQLNAQGEWFYRKSTGALWFYPPSGTNMSTATIELAAVTQLLRFVGSGNTSANSVKYITFNNITLTHVYRSLFDSTGQFYEKITGSDWGIVRKGAVFMQNAENITFSHCNFDQVGGNGVFMSGYNNHNVISNCVFRSTGASCVLLMGLRSSIRCPNSWNAAGNTLTNPSCSDRTPGPLTQDYPRNCVVYNNLMDTLGVFEKQTSGVTFSATEFDTIRHNSIAHQPRAGINFCDGCWGGHVIDYNWVYDCVRETSDHGPFNAWGRDRNIIINSNDLSTQKLDARNPTIVRMNRFESPSGMFGIDLDDQATNYFQEKNLLTGGGFKLQWNRYNTYINNIFLRGANTQFHGVWSSSNHYGARNIMISTQTCIYQVCCGSNAAQVGGAAAVKWDSNIVYCGGASPTISDWNNCGSQVNTWTDWRNAGLDLHSVTNTHPGFVDTQRTWTGRTPPYLPRGDFNPTSSVALSTLRFQTFAMDSFGVIGTTPGVAVKEPFNPPRLEASDMDKAVSVRYSDRRLTVSYSGDYQVAVTSIAGRTLATFNGTGRSSYIVDRRLFGSGTYLAVVHTRTGPVTKRFIVSK